MPDQAALVPTYESYAEALPRVQNRVLTALDETASKDLLDEAAEQLGLMEDGQLFISGTYELTAVADHAFCDLRRDGKNAIQRYLDEHEPPNDPVEAALLTALGQTRWALLFVHTIEPGVGIGTVDVLGGPIGYVVTPDFAEVLGEDGVLIAARVVNLPELTMPTSGAFPLDQLAEQEIYADLEDRFPGRPLTAFADLPPEEMIDFNRIIANAALDAMDWFRESLEAEFGDELTNLDDPAASAPQPPGSTGARPPRGERPKSPKKSGKKAKKRR